jgi:hypothetical protein
MIHIVHSEIAEMYGIEESIILQNIYYWVNKNRANKKNFHDGHYWTYNSSQGLTELFPYMAPHPKGEDGTPDTLKPRTNQRIKRFIKNLTDAGLIKSGNYNKTGYDKTSWYTLTEQGESLFKSINCTVDGLKMNHGKVKNEPPIPKEETKEEPEDIKLHSPKFSKENIQGESDNLFSSIEATQEGPVIEPKKKANPFKLSDDEMKLVKSYHKGFIEEIDKVAQVEYSKDIRHLCRTFKLLKRNRELFCDIYIYFRTYRDPFETYTTEIRSLSSLAEKIDKLQAEMVRETKRVIKEKGSVVLYMDNIKKIAVVYGSGVLKKHDKTRIELMPKTGYTVYDISRSIGKLDFPELGYVERNTFA